MPRVAGVTVGMRGEMARFQADMREGVGIVNRSVNQIKGTLGGLNTFIGATMGAAALKGTVGEIVRVGDAYNQLLGRLKNATAATGDFNRVYQQLYQISQRNGVALADSVSTFQGLARAAGELGKSSAQVIRLTDIVQKLGVAAGASPEAMKNGMTQFQQSMAGGIVRAEEWNSIVENMPSVAAAAAQSMGKSFGELRQMVVKGKLSSEDLFDALMKAGAEADKQFANMPKTVAQAQAKLTNSFGKMVHDLDDVTSATKSVAAGMASIADVIEQNSPKIVQWGRTLSAFMGVLKGEWDNQAISQEMQSLGFSYEQQVKYLEARRKKLQNDALYTNYDFGRGPGESGIPDVFGPNRPGAKPPAKIDQKALDELEKERKKVAEILAERVKERRELELKLKGYDDLRVKYEEEVAYIKSTTLSNKEKGAALKQLADQYEAINQKTKFLKRQEEQKDAIKNAKELLDKAKQAREELEMELGNRAKLTKYLELELQYKKLLAQGNKGSAEAKKLQDDIQKEMEQVKQDEAAVKAKEAYDKIADSTSTYNENMQSVTKNLQIQNDDLQLRLQGEEKVAQFIKAKQEIEQKTNEVLQKKYETLKQIQAIEAESPGNAQVAAYRAKVEQDITNAMAQRDQALKSVDEARETHERLNKALEQQEEILKDIIDSKGKYKDKVNALKDAMDRGYITADQYNKALKQIGKTTKDTNNLSSDLAKGITNSFEKMIFNGGKATDVVKQFGKEIAQLAARRLLLDPLQRKLESLFNTIAGGGTRVPMAPSGYGPLFGGSGIAGGPGGYGPMAGGYPIWNTPYGGPTQMPVYRSNPISDFFGGMLGGMFGGARGGSAPAGGGIGGMLGGALSAPLAGGGTSAGGILGSLIGKLPFFEYGGFLGAGQWGIAGERGPELIYGGNSGMSIIPGMGTGVMGGWQQPWYQRDVYSGGRGGYSGNGMISQLDNSQMLTGLYSDKYNSYVQAANNGEVPMNWYTAQELRYHRDRHAQIVANNGFTGQLFSRQQFEANSAWAEANEASYMWGGQRNDPRRYLNPALWNEWNPNARMNSMSFGIASSGMGQGSSAGIDTGGFLPPGMREASFTIGNGYQPLISTGEGGRIIGWKSDGLGGFSGSYMNSGGSAFSRPFMDLKNSVNTTNSMWSALGETFGGRSAGRGITEWMLGPFKPPSLQGPLNGARFSQPNAYGGRQTQGPYNEMTMDALRMGLGSLLGGVSINRGSIVGGAGSSDDRYVPETNASVRGGARPQISGEPGKFTPYDADRYLNAMGMSPDQLKMFVSMAESAYSAGGRKFQQFTDNINAQYGAMAKKAQGSFETMSAQTLWNAVQNYYKPMMNASSNPFFATQGGYGGMGNVMPGFNLPTMWAEMAPPQLQSTVSNLYNGHRLLADAMPWWTSKTGAAMHFAQMGASGITNPNSLYSQMGSIMQQPWANKSMPFSSYPAAMKLFGYAKGGKYKKDKPMVVGEEGMEIVLPETAGSVVSNSQIKQVLGGGVPQIKIFNQTTGEIGDAQASVDINGIINLILKAAPRAVAQDIRNGGDVSVAIQDRARGIV